MPRADTPQEKMEKITAQKNLEHGVLAPTVERTMPVIRKASDRPVREARNVFNGTKGKLKISDEDIKNFAEAGWHLHIFNDIDGRIEDALSLGYEFVERSEIGGVVANVVDGNTDLGTKVRFRVGTDRSGDGLFAYLMKIPTSIWEDEQQALQDKNTLIDKAIRAGKNTKSGTSPEGFYNAGIKIN